MSKWFQNCKESIKEAKAICTCSIQEAEALCSTTIRETEAQWSLSGLTPFNNHTLKPFSTLKKRLSKRRVRVNSTSSLHLSSCPMSQPPEIPWCMLVTSYHILLGQALTSHPFIISQGASPSQQGSALRAFLPLLHSEHVHLDPSSSITSQAWWMSHLPVGPHPRWLLRGPLVQSSKR